MKAILYLDESGNTGINYMDLTQPVFVVAGWLVGEQQRHEFEKILADVQQKYPESSEISASMLLKTPVGQARAAEMIHEVLGAGIQSFYSIVEKRYAIAKKFVDVFFDPCHNIRATWLSTSAYRDRELLVDQISEIENDAWLCRFASAYRNPTEFEFLAVLHDWMPNAERLGVDVESATKGAIDAIATIVENENYDSVGRKHYEYASLNMPMLVQCARMANVYLLYSDMTADLVYDESKAFERVISLVLRACNNMGVDRSVILEGQSRVWTTGRIQTARPGKSVVESGIQAADVLAGVLAKCTRELLAGSPVPPPLGGISKHLFSQQFSSDPPAASLMCSPRLRRSIAMQRC